MRRGALCERILPVGTAEAGPVSAEEQIETSQTHVKIADEAAIVTDRFRP
jgi:hypothetical protein